MTHDEVVQLLPIYALGALDEDVAAVEAHLRECTRCAKLLAAYRETTATLGEAVEPALTPPELRAAILAMVPKRSTRRWLGFPLPALRLPPRASFAAISALLIVALGFGAGYVVQRQDLLATRSELNLDQQGLVLLTSTETTVERLAPAASLGTGTNIHGHWYHQPGIKTQVLVVEFMPALPARERYYGWLQSKDGSWQLVGAFSLDSKGYGRLILLGTDGSQVRRVVVTRQTQVTAMPQGEFVLSWP